MKFIGVGILFICVLAAGFSKWCMVAAFELNQQYIAKELCVNKTNPSTHCNGHCYLSRQLKNEEKPASPFNTNGSEKFEIQLFCIQLPSNQITCSVPQKSFSSQPIYFTPQEFIGHSFRPPKA